MTEIHHTILVGKKPVPLILKLAENSITLTAHLHAVSPGDRLGSVTLSGDGSSLDLATTQFTNDYRGEIKSVTPFADLEHPGRIPEQNTLIEIDLEGGLVQEVRVNQPNTHVGIHDADSDEVGEDPRTHLLAVYDPRLGQEDPDPDEQVDKQKEIWGEELAERQTSSEAPSDDDIPF